VTGHDERDDTRRLPSRRATLLLVGITFTVYVVGLVVVGVGDALPNLTSAAVPPLVGAFALEVATIASLAMVHRSSALAVGYRVEYRAALNVSMTAFTLTQSIPGGGAVAGAEVVRRWSRFGLEGPYATASLALTATLATSTIALIGAGGVAVSVWRGDLRGRVLLAAIIVLVLLLGLLVCVLAVVRSPKLGARLIRRLGKIHDRLGKRTERWVASLEQPNRQPPTVGALLRIVAWSAVNWSADIAALGLVFIAFGEPVAIATLLVGFAASQLGAAIPITPGGTGFVEGGMVAAFVAVGLPLSVASAVVVTYRVLAMWLPMLAGLPALLRPPPVRN
jgi:putative heme transporter